MGFRASRFPALSVTLKQFTRGGKRWHNQPAFFMILLHHLVLTTKCAVSKQSSGRIKALPSARPSNSPNTTLPNPSKNQGRPISPKRLPPSFKDRQNKRTTYQDEKQYLSPGEVKTMRNIMAKLLTFTCSVIFVLLVDVAYYGTRD